uniref:Ig-like domain-containing protein n=1 Tax=Lygus hesperus TaxID=30085 RepID=A0A146LXC9_LYGHE
MNCKSRRLNRSMLTRLISLVLLAHITGVGGLRSVWLKVPVAVAPGQSATLECNYDLEGEPLYTVKWYKGRQEFFRYVPKEHPHTRVFPLPGVTVDINASGPKMVVLRDIQMELAGRYRCEVSSDAPNFHTEVVSAHMHVVHMLESDPVVRLEKSRYSVGDVLRGNCTSPASNPPANVTWLINGNKINASYISRTPVSLNKIVSQAGLEFEVNTFTQGKMRVTCIADVYGVYTTQTELVLDEEKPRLASVRGSGSERMSQSLIVVATAACLSMVFTR